MCVHNNISRDRGPAANPNLVNRGPEAPRADRAGGPEAPRRTGQTQIQRDMQKDTFQCAKPRRRHKKKRGFFHKLKNAFKGALKFGKNLLGGVMKLGTDLLSTFLGQQQRQAQLGTGVLSTVSNLLGGL